MTQLAPDLIFLLFAAGLLAGALNAVAGGATFFTFPALLIAGLPPLMANATNFVALAPGSYAALPAFRAELRKLGRALIAPLLIGAVGGLVGALALISLGGDIFANAVPYLMAFATLLFASAPYISKAVKRSESASRNAPFITMPILFLFSVYGGYFGAGLGQITLAALILIGYDDFHEANALKNSMVSAISLLSVAVYIFSGAVSWPHAIVMMAGAAVGGFLGASLSKYVPQRALRLGVIVFGVLLTVYYFRTDL